MSLMFKLIIIIILPENLVYSSIDMYGYISYVGMKNE